MRFRKLRIAWWVIWGVLAALLIALWGRSANHGDQWSPNVHFVTLSSQGAIIARMSPYYLEFDQAAFDSSYFVPLRQPAPISTFEKNAKFSFAWLDGTDWHIQAPHWFLEQFSFLRSLIAAV